MQEAFMSTSPPSGEIDYTKDPRAQWDPTAGEDTHLWQAVLPLAADFCDETLKLLHFFRLSGARLVPSENGLKMVPVFSDDVNVSDWPNREKWEMEKQKWLVPKQDTIKAIFAQAFLIRKQKI